MVNEHDDDIEPEVDEGAEVETQSYPGASTDVDEASSSEEQELESEEESPDYGPGGESGDRE